VFIAVGIEINIPTCEHSMNTLGKALTAEIVLLCNLEAWYKICIRLYNDPHEGTQRDV